MILKAVIIAISSASAVLCALSVALWVRSRTVSDCYAYQVDINTVRRFESARGDFIYSCNTARRPGRRTLYPGMLGWKSVPLPRNPYRGAISIHDTSFFSFHGPTESHPKLLCAHWRFWGLEWYTCDNFGFVDDRTLYVPFWIITLLFALLPVGLLVTRLRQRFRSRVRSWFCRCPHCGYDLRATPDRCPECGHVPSG